MSQYYYLANIHLFKVDNRNTRKRCEICEKLTIKTIERRQSFFIVNFEHYFTFFPSVSIVDFEQVHVSWVSVVCKLTLKKKGDQSMQFHCKI